MTARDVAVTSVLLFAFAAFFFIVHYAMNTTVNSMVNIEAINESSGAVTALQGIGTTTNRLDYLMLGIFVGLSLGIVITGFFIGGNPLFMFIYFCVVAIVVAISTILSNTWETISTASVFGTTINSFPITNNIMLNLPIYMSAIGFIGVVVMFAKPYFAGGQQ